MKLISNNGITDPAINLALEEFCVRNLDLTSEEYILIYFNKPCVVIGKHQNVFAEVNLPFLRTHEIPLYRRISGGGAVYHDEKNINFSYIRKFSGNEINNYREFIRPIIKTLLDFGVTANLDERNNIVIDGLKISGNAQFSNMKKMFSHGTMLFDSDLSPLRESLSVREQEIISKSIASVKSSVTNIKDKLSPLVSLEEFTDRLKLNILGGNYSTLNLSDEQWQEVLELANSKYLNEEWNYLRCPDFTMNRFKNIAGNKLNYSVTVSKGIVKEILLSNQDNYIFNLRELIGRKFLYQELLVKVNGSNESEEIPVEELMNFLY